MAALVAGGGGATPADRGFPGIVQPDRTLRIGPVTVPDGVADRAEVLALQVLNEQTGKTYWVAWSGHRWQPWREGFLPLP